MIGQALGPYTIVSRLGAGGMGEVYRARDTKLSRDVAIKVLLPAVANDPDRLARFSREAQVLASLNHPNIAAIYGLEEVPADVASGFSRTSALVMELVEGEDLAQRIARGPIPLDEALPIARQIAEALEAAHDHGIIHRDLKPANIKVRPDGTVKVLDFGLAKAVDPTAGSSATAMNSPTLSIHATEAGLILGTAAYMSPEQAAGKAVDKRSDLWAFGVVLLEMLTGRQVFAGETVSHLIAAVLKDSPDWSALPPKTPASIRRLLRRCLEKDLKRRLPDAADIRLEIDEPAPVAASDRPATGVVARLLPWALVVAFAIVLAISWGVFGRGEAALPVGRLTRFVINPPPGTRISGRLEISPDGSQVAYPGTQQGITRLFVQRLDEFEASPLTGTEGGSSPSFSPDGQWLAFIVGNQLHKLNLSSAAAPVVLGTVNRPLGLSWTTTDTIYYGQFRSGMWSIAADGGEPRAVATLTSEEVDHHNPVLLPGGQAVVFTSHHGKELFSVVAQSLASGERKVLIESGFDARYSPTGHLVYGSENAILAVPFDVSQLEVTGPPVKLVDQVAHLPLTGTGFFRLAANGSLVYQADQPIFGRVLTWVDRSGAETVLPIAPRGFRNPRLSPDGKRLVFAAAERDREDVWTYELATDRLSRVTLGGINRVPIWTADGRGLTYVSLRDGMHHLIHQASDGSRRAEALLSSRNTLAPATWTSDNRSLIYADSPPNGLTEVLLFRSNGSPHTQPVLQKPPDARNRAPALSPDGRWLAYLSDETGRNEIYVESFPASGPRHLLTARGGSAGFTR
ncbi:MAG: protein kinase [Acidobacteriota bacterium]|nr:protein kinase [Acidobacteriota bacterium]